jgi:S-(hydroxymethyl)glutathione dehydrogenase/alcohol dehydrogenase
MTMGDGDPKLVGDIMGLLGKRGRLVIINGFPFEQTDVRISLGELMVLEKEIVGSLYGSANPRTAIPKLLDLYRAGILDLDGMITRRYSLGEINEGYRDMREGKNIRGVLVFE